MAISIGATVTNQIDTGASSLTTASHTPNANTKALVVVVLGYDSSDSDSAISSVKYGGSSGTALTLCDYYRDTAGGDDAFIGIYYLRVPLTYYSAGTVVVTMGGSCTDVSCSVINLVDSTADSIEYDTTNETEDSGDTSHGLTISSVVTGAMAIAGIIDTDANTTDVAPTATYGALVGSEKDFGAQVAECSYKIESGAGSIDLRWTKAATDVSWAMGCTFYSVVTTVTLEDPTAGETVTDTTPPLTFHGHTTDKDLTDNIEYQLEVDTATTFDSQSETTSATYDISYVDGDSAQIYSSNPCYGQAFTSIHTGKVTKVSFRIKKYGGPTGNYYARIYSVGVGTVGTNAKPTSVSGDTTTNLIATSDAKDVATTLTTSYQTITFNFTETAHIDKSNGYIVVVYYTGGSYSIDYLIVGIDGSTPSHEGNYCKYSSANWQADVSLDTPFILYVSPTLISSLSTSASGDFEAGHPWDDAEVVTYTCAELAADTYYWRVRGKDVATGLWGAWSTGAGSGYESFVISAGGTNMQLNIGDTWKDVTAIKVNVGDSWKTVTKAQVNIGDTWKTIF